MPPFDIETEHVLLRRPHLVDEAQRQLVPRSGAVPLHPCHEHLHLAIGEPVVVREVTVARDRPPRRHVPAEHLLEDGARPRPRLLIAGERRAQVALAVARKALPTEDPADFPIEGDRRRDGGAHPADIYMV